MSDPWCYGKRQDRSIYGTDQVCTPGGKTGDCADSGDCTDFSDCAAVLQSFRGAGVNPEFQNVSGLSLIHI